MAEIKEAASLFYLSFAFSDDVCD